MRALDPRCENVFGKGLVLSLTINEEDRAEVESLCSGFPRGYFEVSIGRPDAAGHETDGAGGLCYLCGEYSDVLEEHHVFGGPYRPISERLGLKVNICHKCHRTGRDALHGGGWMLNRALKREFQYKAMWENQWSVEDWIKIFGRSWV